MGPKLNRTTAGSSLMYQAIKDDKLEDVKLLLENGFNVNEPIITTGEFAGFTALHVACMKSQNNTFLMELLVHEYKADVNAIAADGTQPILLACFYQPLDKLQDYYLTREEGYIRLHTLVEANANVNAEFGQEIFSKHVKDRKWCSDFGVKMPLVAYTVLYDKPTLIYYLEKVNLDIISLTNKTLLMYAAEKECYGYILVIMLNVEDPVLMDKLINHRDNDDVPLSHYPFHPKKCGKFQLYKRSVFDNSYPHSTFIYHLSIWGADMYALINNDPATFLPNLLAYRSCPNLLKEFLPYYTSMSLSRVLYYATLPIVEKYKHVRPEVYLIHLQEKIRQDRENCIDIAIKDLVIRCVFRLPVPKQEMKLMDELIASDEKIREFVNDVKKNFVEKKLQEHFVEFGNNKMTSYDFLVQVFDYKKLKLLAGEEDLLDALRQVFRLNFDDYNYYRIYFTLIQTRIKDATERLRLLQSLRKISSLREAIPLPFELVLDIVEYLNNKHLNFFIKAFYSS
ncbi:uncharacterized protein LOC123269924 [Cotesia glomerata]|uniref:uncharacterized protein LOC123269924 n=1 Tax=Cotesia glomerata TaxID=32391 RepID=UPI001D01FE61|nr:uncharacterized protein LOC123269924 [Cotesia glomerata]